MNRGIGASVERLEDDRLVRGTGRFVDDVDLSNQLWMRVVRSEVAHARLRGVDTTAAERMPGVHAVLTGEDVAHVESIPLRLDFGINLDPFLQSVLARDRVRYVGDPVAVVLAEDSYAAEDAASAIEVDYEELPVVLDTVAAGEPDSPSLWDERSNEVACITKSFGDADAAFAEAAHVVSAELRIGRHSGVPMEMRGLVAAYDGGREEYTVWGAALVTHYHRKVLSRLLNVPLGRIHMRNTDVGGSFGVRGDFFPEDFLVPYLAQLTGRPVKWSEDRAENLMAVNHAREQLHRVEAAFDAEGRLLGIRDEAWHNKGAYIRPTGIVVSEITLGMLPWPYRVPAYDSKIHVVTTNKTPVGPYRAPGRYENTFVREHLFNIAAEEIGIDPGELRRINLLTKEEIPHEPDLELGGEPFRLNSGDFTGLLEKTVEAADFESWREEAEQLRASGRLVGTSMAYFMDKSGLGVYETAGIDIGNDGHVQVRIGGASFGQGIETVMAQIASEVLDVDPARIDVIHGDTDLVPDGVGSWSSRSTVIGGSAVLEAAESAAEKARSIASKLLEISPGDLRIEDGHVIVAGSPDKRLSFGEIAEACDVVNAAEWGMEPGLGSREIYIDAGMNYPYGLALCQAEVSPDTGEVRVLRYFVGYEVGRAVNPHLLEGQIVGGMAQGLGGALMEEFDYDERGQPRSTSFMDYLMPTSVEMPTVGTLILEDAPTPTNPLGAKGAGESGIMAVGAAVAGAVGDALGDSRLVDSVPLGPDRVLRLCGQMRNDTEE